MIAVPENSTSNAIGLWDKYGFQALFPQGGPGGVYLAGTNHGVMWEDPSKTNAATLPGDSIYIWEPSYGAGDLTPINVGQSPDLDGNLYANFDLISEGLKTPLTSTAGFLLWSTPTGVVGGAKDWSQDQGINAPDFNPIQPLTAIVTADRVLPSGVIVEIQKRLTGPYVAPSAIDSGFRALGLKTFTGGDFSSTTDMFSTWSTNKLVTFPLCDFTSVTDARWAWSDNKLTRFPYQSFVGCHCTDYLRTWYYNDLRTESVDGILTTIRDNAVSFNLSNGRLSIDGLTNAPPSNGSITGMDGIQAVTDLQAKGWTVATN